VFGFQGRML